MPFRKRRHIVNFESDDSDNEEKNLEKNEKEKKKEERKAMKCIEHQKTIALRVNDLSLKDVDTIRII